VNRGYDLLFSVRCLPGTVPKRRGTEPQTDLPFSRSRDRDRRTLEIDCGNCQARFVAFYGAEEDADTETIDVEKCGLCSGPGHDRSTGWTKFEPEPAVSFVRAELIGFEYTAGYLDDGFVKVCRYRVRTRNSGIAPRRAEESAKGGVPVRISQVYRPPL
jgi:hypothetical protein